VAVLDLGGAPVAQSITRLLLGAQRQQRAGGLNQIARPYQMIPATLVAGIAPRNAEARHHRAGIGLVEMAAEHDRRDQKLFGERRRNIERHCAALAAFGLPRLPWRYVLLQQVVERLQQTRDREGCRRFGTAPKTEREHGSTRQLSHQGGSGIFILPGHRAVTGEVLPALAVADVAGAGSADGIALLLVNRRQGCAERPSLGPQCPTTAIQHDGSAVVVPGGAEMGLRITVEAPPDRQHIAPCVGGDAQAQRVAVVLVYNLDGRDPGRQQPHPIIGDALNLGPETCAVSDVGAVPGPPGACSIMSRDPGSPGSGSPNPRIS